MSSKNYITYKTACQASSDTVEVVIYEDLVQIKQDMQNTQNGGGKRKECIGFSDGSRRRLMQRMAMWNLNDLHLYFVTMTYPGIYVQDWHVWKRDIDTAIKAIERKYECTVGCLWRIEFQKRGAPHFHMILATNKECKNIAVLRREIAVLWADIVKDGYLKNEGKWQEYEQHYKNHVKAGTNVEKVQGRKQLMSYVSKYVAKNTGINAPDKFGRNWGFRDMNGELDFSPVEVIKIDNKTANKLKRLIRRWLRSRGQIRYSDKIMHMGSYSVFGLGVSSSSRNAIYRMVKWALDAGLLAAHNLPEESTGRFIDRVTRGAYGARWQVEPEMRVKTPYGVGTVWYVQYVEMLKCDRVRVELDNKRDGVKVHTFYPHECKKWKRCNMGN